MVLIDSDKLEKRFDFLREVEKSSCVLRKIRKSNSDFESNSDHSFSLAMFIMVFKDCFDSNLDYTKMLELALIHDLPEIYSGDDFPFAKDFDLNSKKEKELTASEKLFSKLDPDLKEKFLSLYFDYMNLSSSEAEIVKALDKIQPDFLNLIISGENWKEYDITFTKLIDYKNTFVSKNEFTKFLFDNILDKGLKNNWLKK